MICPSWSRIVNVFRGDRLSREIDEELAVAHRGSHRAGPRSGRGPPSVRLRAAPARREPRYASSAVARFAARRRRLRLAATQEEQGDLRRGDPVAGARASGRAPRRSGSSTPCCCGPCRSPRQTGCTRCPRVDRRQARVYDGWAYPVFRLMRAAVKDQAELIAVSMTLQAHGSDLRLRSGDGEGVPAIRSGLDVRLVRTPARRGPAAHRKRRSQARRASVRRALLRLLDAPLRAGSESDRPHISHGPDWRIGEARTLRDRRRRPEERFTGTEPGTVTDIFVPAMMHPHRSYQTRLADAGSVNLACACRRRRPLADDQSRDFEQERAKGFTGMPKQTIDTVLSQMLLAGTRGRGRLRHATRLPPVARGSRRAGGAGAADRLRERRQPDDRASGHAGARDGAARLDRRGTMAAGATGAGGKRHARFPRGRGRRAVRVVVRAVRGEQDQSARQSRALVSSGGLAGAWIRPGADPRRDVAVRPGARAARLGRQAGQRAQGRRRSALAAPLDACADRACRSPSVFWCCSSPACLSPRSTACRISPPASPPNGCSISTRSPRHAEPPVYWDQVAEHLRACRVSKRWRLPDWPLLTDTAINRIPYLSTARLPPRQSSWFMNVSPGWIEAMKIPLLDGRDFRASDISPGVAIVNQAFAKQYFDGQNPVGSSFEGTSGYAWTTLSDRRRGARCPLPLHAPARFADRLYAVPPAR